MTRFTGFPKPRPKPKPKPEPIQRFSVPLFPDLKGPVVYQAMADWAKQERVRLEAEQLFAEGAPPLESPMTTLTAQLETPPFQEPTLAEKRKADHKAKNKVFYGKLAESFKDITRKRTPQLFIPKEKTFELEDLVSATLEGLPAHHGLAPSSLQFYTALLRLAHVDLLKRFPDRPQGLATQHVFHHSVELLGHCMGYSRSWTFEVLAKLETLQLVRHEAHVSACGDLGNRNDGSLFAVCLKPAQAFNNPSFRLRFTLEDFQHNWRDLEADRKAGNTVYNAKAIFTELTGHSEKTKGTMEGSNFLVNWTLNPSEIFKAPVSSLNVRSLPAMPKSIVYSLRDAVSCSPEERAEVIAHLAKGLSALLGDKDQDVYMFVLWRLVKLHGLGTDLFEQVKNLLERCLTDHQDGFARKAGAMFIARLQEWGVWDHFKALRRSSYLDGAALEGYAPTWGVS